MALHRSNSVPAIVVLALSWILASCDGGTGPTEEPPENLVGPDGGTVTVGRLTLDVPAGALADEVEITAQPITPASGAVPGGYAVVEGTAYDLGPDGLVFQQPAELTLAYESSAVPPGVLESELGVLVNDGDIAPLESTVDVGAGLVRSFMDHFSTVVVGIPEGEYQRVACPNLAVEAASGRPLDRIGLGRVPDSFEPPLLARVEAVAPGDGGDLPHGFALVDVDGTSGEAELVVPIHPSASPDGGEAHLLVTDGTLACAPFDFTVDAMEPAPGELAAIADHLQDIFREQALVLDTSPEEIVATSVDELPPALYPLALVQSTLDHPDNDRSLAAIAEGATPSGADTRLDLVEPLLARTGLRQELAVVAAEARQALAAADARSDPSRSTPTASTISSDYCTPEEIGNDAGLLDACMSRAWSEAFRRDGASGEVLDDLGKVFGVAGLVPGLGAPTAIAGFVTWLMADLNKRNATLLPSVLTGFTVDHDPGEFLEDEGGAGTWSDASLTASNLSWDMGQEVLEGLLQTAGVIGAFDKVQISPTEISDLMNYILTNPVAAEFLDGGTIEAFKTEPQTFGPVDATADAWTESRLVSGDAVELTAHDQYQPRRVGTSTISVRTEDGKFGGQQRADQFDVTVQQLDVDISPVEVHLEAGEPQDFTVTVTDSEHPEMVEVDESVELQGTVQDISYVGEGLHIVAYTAPPDPDPDDPDVLAVRHTAQTGARADGPPRTATATIRFGDITISPSSVCLDPGETQQFTAEVEGLDDETVVWSADVGEIDAETGLYQAPPTQPSGGTATITATSAVDPDLSDSVTITIGSCSCIVSVEVDGRAGEGEGLPRFTLTDDAGAVEGMFSFLQAVGDESGNVSWGFASDPFGGTPLPVGTTGGPFDVVVDGVQPGVGPYHSYFTAEGDETGLQVQAHITQNDGDVLAGTLSGGVWIWFEDRAGMFSMQFRIEADSAVSTQLKRRCILE